MVTPNRNLALSLAIILIIAISTALVILQASGQHAQKFDTASGYEIIAIYPHDTGAFTEGLSFHDGFIYEGTGLYGKSTLRRVILETGAIVKIVSIPDSMFGEGVVVLGDCIVQLTWRSNTGLVYDLKSLTLLGTFSYPMEGWGLTYDGSHLIMSDGTSTIYFLEPETFAVTKQLHVRDRSGRPLALLNELEYINGEIYANVWQTDLIARISPETGLVSGWIDLTGLLQTQSLLMNADVLNGIAYDPEQGRLFVTGKFWPFLFQIRVVG